MFRRFSRSFLSLTGVAAVALSLSACSVHWDYGHPILPEISADSVKLQELVASEVRFAEAAQKVRDCKACQPLLQQFVADSPARQQALGGVWNPWPQGIPQGAPLPPGADLPAFSSSPAELAEQLVTDGFNTLRILPQIESASDRQLAASVSVTRIYTGIRLAQADGSWDQLRAKLAADEHFFPTVDSFPEDAAQISLALRDWDCALQVMPAFTARATSADLEVWHPRVRQLSLQLEQNISAALSLQVADKRLNSCVGASEAVAGKAPLPQVLPRLFDQLLVSTALAVGESPQAGKSFSAQLPQSSFAYAVLVELIAESEFPLGTALPGIVPAAPAK
ncbi:MAG: hypothetical protein Q4D73_03025 [Actinomycetaceae bacterium]|nr:hypothetical protein [Actinomycetaceae bacterium]